MEDTIIDVHHHWGNSPETGVDGSIDSFDQRVEMHMEYMEINGISKAVLMPTPNYDNPNGTQDTREINREIAKIREQYPEQFPAALGTVEPSYAHDGLTEIDYLMSDLGLDGVMWHNRWQKAEPHAPIMYDLVERVEEYNGVVALHIIAQSMINAPWRVFQLIEDFPEVQFLLLSSLATGEQFEYMNYRVPEFDNVMCDTAIANNLTRKTEKFVTESGSKKLIFGTDYYTRPPRRATEKNAVQFANISESDKKDIFKNNAKRFFDI